LVIQSNDDALIVKSVEWTLRASAEIAKSGGVPEYVLSQIPDKLKTILIRNDIELKYTGYLKIAKDNQYRC
jgi:hypothetical protein